jgi:N-acetyl-anhydromuramyl-L-alanine amidase AmpD
MTPEYIVIHTAAFSGNNCDKDMIDRWHRDKGWNGIGYHYVILNDKHSKKADGTVEKGRPDNVSGAHAYGINGRSLGICCIGHGDEEVFTQKQSESLNTLVNQLMSSFDIPISNVIGHRELNLLVKQGKLDGQYKTSKSCPGKKIDMDLLRQKIAGTTIAEAQPSAAMKEIQGAIDALNKHRMLFPNAQDELNEFLYHPEVIPLS